MGLIAGNVADEIRAAIGAGDRAFIGDGFVVYGLYDEEQNAALGALAVQLAGSVVVVRSVYVAPEYRSFGGAKMLVQELISDCFMVDGIEEIEFLANPDNEYQREAADFLCYNGFKKEDATDACFVSTLEKIAASGVLKKIPAKGVTALSEIDERLLNKLGVNLASSGNAFIDLPIDKSHYEQDLSMAVVKDDKDILDILLMEKEGSDLVLSFAYSEGSGVGILSAFAKSLDKALEKYPKETKIRIPTVTASGRKLAEKVVPDAKVIHYVRCFYPLLPLYELVYGREQELSL